MAHHRSSLAIALTGRMDPETPNHNHPTSNPTTTTTHTTMKLRLKNPRPDALASRLGTSAPVRTTSAPGGKSSGGGRTLPTPPNSISPTLPPAALKNGHNYTAGAGGAATSAPNRGHHILDPVDSDLELRSHASSPLSHHDLDTLGSITPALLATHHLPSILLSNGPLAIRHIMGYLTTSVPGFSSIPPAKARRLVVGALEGRGDSAGGGGGVRGDVRFEKVGWGRWDARLLGQAPWTGGSEASLSPTPPAYGMGGMAIQGARESNVRRPAAPSSDWTGEQEDVDMDMDMEDLDHMSLDEPCSSSSEAPDEEGDEDAMSGLDDPELATDDEDWEAMGPQALRDASYQGSAPRMGGVERHLYTGGSVRSYSYQGSASLVKPTPAPVLRMRSGHAVLGAGVSGITNGLSFEGRRELERRSSEKCSRSYLETGDAMEKDAVEALLKLSGSPAV